MQGMWSTATIEICSYTKILTTVKLIGHFKHTVVTLGLLWYQRLIALKTPARQLAQITSLTSWAWRPGNEAKHPQGHYNCIVMEIFCALKQ